MPLTRGARRHSSSDEIIPATDYLDDDEFSDEGPRRSRSALKRKRSSMSASSSKSSPPASAWTRAPPKPMKKKKKKLIAGRELRDRGVRKVYAESSSSEYEEEEEGEEDDVAEADGDGHFTPDEEEVEEPKPQTRRIILRISSQVLKEASQTVEETDTNGVVEEVEEEKDALADQEVEDLQAEVEELKQTVNNDDDEDDDDDEGGPRRLTRRVTRQSSMSKTTEVYERRPSHGRKGVARQDKSNGNGELPPDGDRRSSMRDRLRQEARRPSHSSKKKKKAKESESEFEEDEDAIDDDISMESEGNVVVDNDSEESYSSRPRRKHNKKPSPQKKRRSRHVSDEDSLDEDNEDLLEELREIGAEIPQRQRQLRPTERMNYFIPPPPDKDDIFLPAATPTRKRNGAGKGLGGFGGFGGDFSGMGLGDRFRGITGLGTAGGADDSSDSDEEANKRRPSAAMGALMPSGGGISGLSGTPANLGKYTPKSKLADADPLEVDQNIDFSAVGGLDDYINQLKEMVTLPLLYPEIFQRFNVTPPRGVLFHGPPGTGKTLMARALAASCSTEGRKISFFMRKGADCLSKWVGEAERQLRLLFEEARNSQPSIIFFDEIDGLAPVRSSKQEQIHASIVSTLLALMDGMDGRGQVIIIGATNRPDAVDPALRRPGRFDREFYFPLPDVKARKSIIDIHTKKWDPPLDDDFKMQLAIQTKGYGGADLRALCTEAALNAIQRRYPQIYSTAEKLVVDPKSINVIPRDFMIATEKIVASSERSSSSGAAPLPSAVKPLLDSKLEEIKTILGSLVPEKKKRNVLEEAMYEEEPGGFETEVMMQAFESARTFRPRLLIYGKAGMGQQYLGAAILHHLEKTHVQSFDLATLMGDSARTPESAVVQLFIEVKRHKPSVIYIPNMDLWFRTISDAARETFMTLIRGISPSDPILLLALIESPLSSVDPDLRAIFGYSLQNRVEVASPSQGARYEYFKNAICNLDKAPTEFPDAVNKRKRVLEVLEKAPPPPPKVWTKGELDEHATKDKQTINTVKIKLSGLMDLLKKRYQRFRKSVIDDRDMELLARGETEPECLAHTRFRRNEDGMIRDVTSNKKFYGMDLDQVNDRIWNGYYLTPAQFVFDIQCMVHDAKTWPDRDRTNRAEEMLVNTQTYISEVFDETLNLECQRMAAREFERQKIKIAEKEAKAKKKAEREKEKERLRLAAQQAQQNQSPTKPIEPPPSNDVQMIEANGNTQELEMISNGTNHEGSHHLDQSVVPESSPFANQNDFSQSQPYVTTPSTVPAPIQPYQSHPAPNPNYAPIGPHSNPPPLPTYAPNPPAFANISQPLSITPHYPGGYNPGQQHAPFFPQPTYADPQRALSPSQFPSTTVPTVPMLPHQMSPSRQAEQFQSQDHPYYPASHTPTTFGAYQLASNSFDTMRGSPRRNLSPQRPVNTVVEKPQHPPLKRDPARVERLLQDVTLNTEGYTLEQLEQVYAACMDVIWRLRHEWDRTVVIGETEKCIRQVLHEIQMMKSERQRDELDR